MGKPTCRLVGRRYNADMRSRAPLLAFVLVAGTFVFPHLAQAAIPFFGPIIPNAANTCPAGWGLLIIVINNIISLLITLAIVFVAPIMIAYAGFLYVVNPINPDGKKKARSILLNTIVGIVIALASWLIVDAIMATLYNPAAVGGTWYSLISSGGASLCLPQAGSLVGSSAGPNMGVTGVTTSGSYLSFGTGACSSATVQQGAQLGGYNLTVNQANTLACIAKPESSCGAINLNYNWGKGSSAAGAFQVLLQGNSNCYNNTACEQAVGASGPLNCASGFSGGNPKSDAASQAIVQKCVQAAANVSCSAAAAACVLQQQGYGAWTADPSNATQAQCVSLFSGQ